MIFSLGRGRSLAGVAVALAIVFSLLEPDTFPTRVNFESMAFQMSEVGLLALAIALTMIGGGIDLSVVANANLSAIVAGAIVTMHGGDGTPPALLLLAAFTAVFVGMTVGLINGGLVAYGGIHPILATLATLTLATGLATAATGGSTVFGQGAFDWIGRETVWVFPVPLVAVLVATFTLAVVLKVTIFGVRLYLIGSNPVAASFSAIPVRRTLLLSYVVSGGLAAVSGFIVLGRTNAASVDFGSSFVLLAILIVVLAGINPYGGEGRIADVVVALTAVQLLSTGINTSLSRQTGSNFLKEASWGLLLVVMLAVPAIRMVLSRWTERASGHEYVSDVVPDATTPAGLALRLSRVSKSFGGVQALNNASLGVAEGTIHALVGENGSGKSTLTKIAAGVHTSESGTVEIGGTVINKPTPKTTSQAGLEVIYQDLALFPDLTVAENIYLAAGRAHPGRRMRWSFAKTLAETMIADLGVDIETDAIVGSLSVAKKQLVAIARALSTDARIIIMDEPTAALTPNEVDQLISIVRSLANQGLSFVFISHKLEEVLTLADEITVIRDGIIVAAGPCDEFDANDLQRLMSGDRELTPERTRSIVALNGANPAVEFRGASIAGHFSDVSFKAHPGQVIGIGGPLGSGRREIALALFGLLRLTDGSMLVDGRLLSPRNATEAQQNGIGLVPEDRRTEGLFMSRTIGENITAASLQIHSGRIISQTANYKRATAGVQRLHIRTPDHRDLVTTLSGGNQQRVVLSKWIQANPRVLVLDRPTVGIDVGSKIGIYDVINELADDGVAILLVTDEIDELMNLCDQILVMNAGQLVAAITPRDVDTRELLRLVTGREQATC